LRDTAVRVGRLWIPGKQVEQTLARYGKLLFCINHSDEHPYSLVGSATAVRLNGECLLFCCHHQIKDYPPDDVVISTDKTGTILVSSSAIVWRESTPGDVDEEYHDLRAMKFEPTNYVGANMGPEFFDLQKNDCWNGDKESTFFLFGYPTSLRNVDYEIPHINVQQIVTSASYVEPSNARGLHRLRMSRLSGFSSDGLSGAPVFHLSEDAKGFFAGFAGIVTRGSESSEIIHFLDARQLTPFFQK
jgi:hypothetical protein